VPSTAAPDAVPVTWVSDRPNAAPALPPEDTSRAAYEARQAELAWRTARAAATPQAALPWLERAARFTTTDENLRFNIATARLATGDATGAYRLFRAMSERFAVREAWTGRAAAALQLGKAKDALVAIEHALRHFAPDPTLAGLATGLTAQAGLAGWCGIAGDGTLIASTTLPVTLRFAKTAMPGAPGEKLDRAWMRCRQIHVLAGGAALLGSPIDGTAISRLEGFVEQTDSGLRGWAWHPGAPELDPVITLQGSAGRQMLTATDLSEPVTGATPLSRPRGFSARIGFAQAWRVTGPDGRDLLGSPLGGPAVIPAAPSAAAATGVAPTGTTVVIPIYRDVPATLACLRSVLATIGPEDRVIVVNDASPEPDMLAALGRLPADPRLNVIPSNPANPAQNLGFPRAANAGMAQSGGRDVVLLNSDTRVFPHWLTLLRAAARSAPDIASATPLSNDASIFSYPAPDAPGPMPDPAAGAALARLAARANAGLIVDVPTGNGFCLYLRADALRHVGLLREDAFAQGYGEENDWTERARLAGWRHVAVPSVFVAHAGGASFGAARSHLLARNSAILARLHPGYPARVAAWIAADPLRPARTRLATAHFHAGAHALRGEAARGKTAQGDALRTEAGRTEAGRTEAGRDEAGAVLLISHGGIGGTQRVIATRAAAIRAGGQRPLLLTARDGTATLTEAELPPRTGATPDGAAAGGTSPRTGDAHASSGATAAGIAAAAPRPGAPRLHFTLPADRAALMAVLRAEKIQRVEIHHLLGHHPGAAKIPTHLQVPYEVWVHDYGWLCPRLSFTTGAGQFCGEAEPSVCAACTRDWGHALHDEIPAETLRAASATLMQGASRVVVPARDVARRLCRHVPGIEPEVMAWEDEPPPPPPPPAPGADGILTIAVVGAISLEKGYEVLRACATDAAIRRLPLRFQVIGYTVDDEPLMQTGRVFITGRYAPHEVGELIRTSGARLAFLPSIWPETWCFALTETWRAGLRVAAFDIGAPAERIGRRGAGWVLPLGLPPARVNEFLLRLGGFGGAS